jgi:hypothetical protein
MTEQGREKQWQRMGALGGLLEVGGRTCQRWKSQTAPTMIAASNGMPRKLWVHHDDAERRWGRRWTRARQAGTSAASVIATVA